MLVSTAFVGVIILYESTAWLRGLNISLNYALHQEPRQRWPTRVPIELYRKRPHFRRYDELCNRVDLSNISLMTSERQSSFHISSCGKTNNTCKISVIAMSQSKKRKTIGGDLFLMWAEQKGTDGRAAGQVIDNGNGTYTGIIAFPWTAETVIRVKLGSTLENYCRRKNAMVKYGNSVFANKMPWGIQATFRNKLTREVTRCGMYDKIHGYPLVCNLTRLNDGSPWFCGKPNDNKLRCQDVYEFNQGRFRRLEGDPNPNSTEVISHVGHGVLERPLTLKHVTPTYLKRTKVACTNVSKRLSWLSDGGFYLNGKWHMPFCESKMTVSKDTFRKCLQNKTMVFLGDSTIREYASFLLPDKISLLSIDIKNRNSKNRTYHPQSTFNEYGIRIVYKKHELPFHHSNVPVNGVTSLATELVNLAESDIPGDDLIVLMNYDTHMHAYPPDEIRVRFKRIASAVNILLHKKPTARVFYKGPHVCFDDSRYFDLRVSLIYKDIIFEEFKHLFDKVIYLDVWSISLAFNNEDLHPQYNAKRSQLQQFMSFIC